MSIIIHKKEDFFGMKKAGVLACQVLDHLENIICTGISTGEINDICHKKIIEAGAIPAPLGYKGFPKSVCTSINNIICHGIPSYDVILKDGDIINVDVTVILDGWHGDSSRMYFANFQKSSSISKKLVQVTYDAMMIGIDTARAGVPLSLVGKKIQDYSEKNGFSVVRDYCGHGIGMDFHAEPSVIYYYSSELDSVILKEGMFLTIEPMINVGKYHTMLLKDGWTVVTRDKSLSAQFEHTIGIRNGYPEIFTTEN